MRAGLQPVIDVFDNIGGARKETGLLRVRRIDSAIVGSAFEFVKCISGHIPERD